MRGQARDLATTLGGDGVTFAAAAVVAQVDGATRALRTLATQPERLALQRLVGTAVGPGFRAKVMEVEPERRDDHSPLSLLLDDLPGAALVSGYAWLRADVIPARGDTHVAAKEDLCAGWARDGTMMIALRTHGRNPTPLGPVAPALDRVDDNDSWHDLGPLEPTATRRLRRIDVGPVDTSGTANVDAFFRDTYAEGEGEETIMHEYAVRAAIDVRTRTILDIAADADVLPWKECPAATASAARLIGRGLRDLRPHVRETFVGTSTCTHLNDVLRGLSDVDDLLEHVAGVKA